MSDTLQLVVNAPYSQPDKNERLLSGKWNDCGKEPAPISLTCGS